MTTTKTPRHRLVAEEVRAALGRRNYKQKDLAEFFQISRASASELYNGVVPYSIDRLDAIAGWLDVRITDLLGDRHMDGGERRISSGWRRRLRVAAHLSPQPSHELRQAA